MVAELRADQGDLGPRPAERRFAPALAWQRKGRLRQKITEIGGTAARFSRHGLA